VLDPSAFAARIGGEEGRWLAANVPDFDCPDPGFRAIYDFRWRVFKEHIRPTPDGFVVTEFLPDVPWAGKHNTISCAAGHHFREGRWIRDPKVLDGYAAFWFRKGGEPRRYSFWAADSIHARYLASGDPTWPIALLPDLVANYEAWEKDHCDPGGLFWQIDDRDGMEYSIGGSGYRPSINASENLDPDSGRWIARDILHALGRPDKDRGRDYNHSGFCDLVVTSLVGLRPRADRVVEVNPLVPEGSWDSFCLDGVPYHGRQLTVLYDRDGRRYGRGAGLRVLVDGVEVAAAGRLGRLTGKLPAVGAPEAPAVAEARQERPPADGGEEGAAGWRKFANNPVLGANLGTCFDVSLLREGKTDRMWFSWRPKKAVALVEGADGIHWGPPVIVLGPNPRTDWEEDINRPVVVKRPDGYHMWYTGQARGHSWIGHATSPDGKTWTRTGTRPVFAPEAPWEKAAVMCPHVLWDEETKRYRMWYSGGEQYEPDAIGYATSADGLSWTKHADNPIFRADSARAWERHKVTACQVVRHGGWYVMFYIGFRDIDHAQIGLARSRDGISGWERHPANPILRPGAGKWDADAIYKPFAIPGDGRWRLWYNGRRGSVEQIGMAIHEGDDLGFPGR